MTKRRGHGEGSIYKRERDGRWVGNVTLGYARSGRQRKEVTGRTQQEVRQKVREIQRALEDGMSVVDSTIRLDAYLDRWLADVIMPGTLADKTKTSYESTIRLHIKPTLGHLALSKVTPQSIQHALASKRSDGLGDRSVQLIHATLRVALKQAVTWGVLRNNPTYGVSVPRPKRDTDRVHALDIDSVRRLLEAARGERLEALMFVLVMLGLRKGEALGLRWSSINWERSEIVIDRSASRKLGIGMVLKAPKSAASVRGIVLPPPCADALRQHHRRQAEERLAAGPLWKDNDLVFCTEVGCLLDESIPNSLLHRLCESIGIPRERVHNLRHTAATIAGEVAQGDLHAVTKLLGHSTISTTIDMYRHSVSASQQRLAEGMGNYFTSPSTGAALSGGS